MRSQRMAWTLSSVCCSRFPVRRRPNRSSEHDSALGREPASADDADDAQQQMAHDIAKKANQSREAALKADTDKLLKLAVELKDYVDKSNENVLSLDVVKKADEIEKLAHSVKDKMKGPN